MLNNPEEILRQQAQIARGLKQLQEGGEEILSNDSIIAGYDADIGKDIILNLNGSIRYAESDTNGTRGLGETILLHDGETTHIDAPPSIKKELSVARPRLQSCTGRVAIVFTKQKYIRTETRVVRPLTKVITYGFHNEQIFTNLREYENYSYQYSFFYNFGSYSPGRPPNVQESDLFPPLNISYNPQIRNDNKNYLLGYQQPEVDLRDPDQPPYWRTTYAGAYNTPNTNEFYLGLEISVTLNLDRGDQMPPLPIICSTLETRFVDNEYTYSTTSPCEINNPIGTASWGYIKEEILPRQTISVDLYDTEFYLGGIYKDPIRLHLPEIVEGGAVALCTVIKRKVIVKILYDYKYIRAVKQAFHNKIAIYTITSSNPDNNQRDLYTYPQAITPPDDDWLAPLYISYKPPFTKAEISDNHCIQDYIDDNLIQRSREGSFLQSNTFSLKIKGEKLYYVMVDDSYYSDMYNQIRFNNFKVHIKQFGLFQMEDSSLADGFRCDRGSSHICKNIQVYSLKDEDAQIVAIAPYLDNDYPSRVIDNEPGG